MNSNHWQHAASRLDLLPFTCKIKHIPVKRIFDICFSLLILLLALPLCIIIGIIIKTTSKGPVFYSQERVGRGGIPFRCIKFRTMHYNADQKLQSILEDPVKKHEWQSHHKLKKDPRITFIGKLLRKISLDELPQFWNVIKGDLSVVGPRPVVREEIIRHYGPKAYKILSIRPGVTGIWQVSGRNNTGYTKRVLLDEQYVDTRSFILDLKIILKTIPSMITPKGAY